MKQVLDRTVSSGPNSGQDRRPATPSEDSVRPPIKLFRSVGYSGEKAPGYVAGHDGSRLER